MTTIFLGGSRRITRLDKELKNRLSNIIANGHTILVGDANGADKAIQSFFYNSGYKEVIVYYMDDECRNNIGNWKTRSISSEKKKKDFSYFSIKDEKMSSDADYGFMLWDGNSKGTINNVLNLIKNEKPSLLYISKTKEFLTIKEPNDLLSVVSKFDQELIDYLNQKIKLEYRIEASKQKTLDM